MKRSWSKTIREKLLFVLAFVVGVLILTMPLPSQVAAQTAETLNLQGKIVRNDSSSEGLNVSSSETTCIQAGADTCAFEIAYYTAVTGGTLLGSEVMPADVEIGDNDGVFNLALGTGTFTAGSESTFLDIYNNNTTVYTEVRFDHDGNDTYTEIFARMANRAAPFALNSNNLGGRGSDDYVQLSPSAVQTDATTTSSIFINKTGASGNIVQLQKGGSDVFVVDNDGKVGIGDTSPASLLTIGNGDLFQVDSSGDIVAINNITYS